MTLYPPNLLNRFAANLADLARRVTKLESRTAAIDSGFPLAVLPATIDSGYSSGAPKAYINGSTTLTGPYEYLASYTPAANDLVAVVPIGAMQTYLVLGKML